MKPGSNFETFICDVTWNLLDESTSQHLCQTVRHSDTHIYVSCLTQYIAAQCACQQRRSYSLLEQNALIDI